MKKIVLRTLCLLAVAILALVPLFAQADGNYGYFYVKTDNGKTVNLRSDPWKGDNVIARIPYRSLVLIYEYSENGVWAYVETDNPNKSSGTLKGWIQASFLVRNDPGKYNPGGGGGGSSSGEPTFGEINSAAKAMRLVENPYITVIKTKKAGNLVHLRWFPSTYAAYSGAYLCDTEIRVLALSKTWAQVEIVEDGHVGFILRSCVTE